MNLLLDTQLAVWWQILPERLPGVARELVEKAAETVYVSRASLWEMAIKAGIGKLRLDLPRFVRQVESDGFIWLGIETEHLLHVASLPRFDDHKDQFDRLLVAQSLTEPLILLTVDAKLSRYGTSVRVV